MMDYKKLDQKIKFRYPEEKKEITKSLGFDFISEAVVKLYPVKGSIHLAKTFDVTRGTIMKWLGVCGVQKRGKGGDHRVWIKKYGSENCVNCGQKTIPGQRGFGRCLRCYKYFKRHGIEYPHKTS